MESLLTIGYEGSDIDTFLETLVANNVDVLLDVRELPVSRKKGFSKNKFRQALAEQGIGYRHEKRLGSPRDIRKQLYQDKDYQVFFKAFDEHLSDQRDLLLSLTRELEGNVALMCFERDVMGCHRRSVARELGEILGTNPKHLVVKARKAAYGNNRTETNLHSGQSLPAAQ